MAIFNNWHLPFLNVLYSPFPKNETLQPWHNLLLINSSKLLNWKGPETGANPNLKLAQKNPESYFPCLYLVYILFIFITFGVLMSSCSEDLFNMHPVSFTNTHHDVAGFVNHRIVKNPNTWTSWEQNINFLRNKKILNLHLRWCIFRSDRFVAEVTFKGKTFFTEDTIKEAYKEYNIRRIKQLLLKVKIGIFYAKNKWLYFHDMQKTYDFPSNLIISKDTELMSLLQSGKISRVYLK